MVHGTGFGGTNFSSFANPAAAWALGCWIRIVLIGYGPCWETSQKHLTTPNPLDVCALQFSLLLRVGMWILCAREGKSSYLALLCTLVLQIYYLFYR